MALIECVPNFSEGRDKFKVDAIVAAMKMDGVYVLDQEMDADHNRCVITLVGNQQSIAEAAIRGVGKAAELIDLTKHQGVHPRMGAADVVPFVPIEGATLEDCVRIARHVGREIWNRYKVPIYFYESAATKPERTNLESIRRGQFEGIRAEVATNPDRCPDIGDPCVHPTAGSTVVGARKFLIAYNVFLNTPDVEIARKVAKAVRFSSGGLPFVKAAGFLVRGLAQVSMNLTDFEQTPVARVFEMVRREAANYGASPISSEIVGLIPKKALEDAAASFLQIESFDTSLIFENRLSAVMGRKMIGGLRGDIEPFLEQLATPNFFSGGGIAFAAVAAMAAALTQKVASMSIGKKELLNFEVQLHDSVAQLTNLRDQLKQEIDERAILGGSQEPIDGASKLTSRIPIDVASKAREVERIINSLEPLTDSNFVSDLAIAKELARAAQRWR